MILCQRKHAQQTSPPKLSHELRLRRNKEQHLDAKTNADVSEAQQPAVLEMVLGGSSTHVATVLTAICQNTGKGGVDFRAETRDEGNQVITYQELWARVNEVAAMLRDFAAGSLGIRISCTALWP